MRGEGGQGVCATETPAQVAGSMAVPTIERGAPEAGSGAGAGAQQCSQAGSGAREPRKEVRQDTQFGAIYKKVSRRWKTKESVKEGSLKAEGSKGWG